MSAQPASSALQRPLRLAGQVYPEFEGLRPGVVVDGCELERELDRGLFGSVWLARQSGLDRPVALKLIDRSLDPDGDDEERRRRAERIAALEHPNLVAIYGFGTTQRFQFLVREHVAGVRLDRVLSRLDPLANGVSTQRMPVPARILGQMAGFKTTLPDRLRRVPSYEAGVAYVVNDLASGLAHAHANGVLHLAIWPGNVVIDATCRTRLFDFSLAPKLCPLRQRLFCGYVSPEQEAGEAVDPRSDLFSLGALLYRALTLQMPFPLRVEGDRVTTDFTQEPVPVEESNPFVPRALAEITMQAVQVDRERRFPTARAFHDALEDFLAEQVAVASRGKLWRRLCAGLSWPRRGRRRA